MYYFVYDRRALRLVVDRPDVAAGTAVMLSIVKVLNNLDS